MIERIHKAMPGKKIVASLAMLMIASPAFAATDSCRNTQIMSYSPEANARVVDTETFEFHVTEDTDIDSVKLTINDRELALEHDRAEDDSYKVWTTLPSDMEGSLFVDMEADSDEDTACNDTLATSFVLGSYDKYNEYGVLITPPKQTPVVVQAPESNTQTQVSENTQAPDAPVVAQNDREETIDVEAPTSSASSSEEATSSEVADSGEGNEEGNQSASLWSSIAGIFGMSGQSSCNVLGASWAWYIWLGIVWIWLVALWVVVNYTVEPVLGTSRYVGRLAWTMALGTLAALVFWYLANPCFTNLWVPALFVVLGALLYWLYSEDDDTTPSTVVNRY